MKSQKAKFGFWRLIISLRILLFILLAVTFTACLKKSGSEFSGPLGNLAKLQVGNTCRSSSADSLRSSNKDRIKILPGETRVLADIKGSGSIRHIWMTFPAPDSSWLCLNGCSNHSQLVIRMYWDGASEPAVEAPVGDFFALGFGLRADVNSVPVIVEGGDSYNCYWIMPFSKSARIEVENQGEQTSGSFYYQVDYQVNENHSSKTLYFCAQYRQEFPCGSGKDYLILDAEGKGQYVGTVLNGRSRSPEWFGEGDEKFYIDGDTKPTIQGTGTEDYILHAWGFNDATSYPYFGVPIMEGPNRMVGWKMSMYRWHILEPISFNKSLRVEIEDAGWISEDEAVKGTPLGFVERNDDFSSVAFWYQTGQPKRYAVLPGPVERELPNLDIIVEGTELMENAKYPGGIKATIEKGYPWTGKGQVHFSNVSPKGNEVGSWIECDFYVEVEELRQLTLRMTKAIDLGIYRVYVDGKPIIRKVRDKNYRESTIDWYDFYNPYVIMTELGLGQYTLSKGKHTIRLECIGKNSISQSYGLGFDSIRLRERWKMKRTTPANL